MLHVRGSSLWRKLRRRAEAQEIEALRPEFELHMIQALIDEGVPEPKARHDVATSHARTRDIDQERALTDPTPRG